MSYRQTIAAAYDAGVQEEFNRLSETPLREAEYKLITELLDEYIPSGATVIDIGSGPGRYAEHLLERNCKVGVIDLSARSLKAFSDRMENSCCRENIIFNQVSCATQLGWIADNSSDSVLLMGPLYHLINEEHRNQALSHCHRILRPGGFLFAIFLSPFPVLRNMSGSITHTRFQGFDVPQFRCWPPESKRIMLSHCFETIRIRNLEGVGSFLPDACFKGSWPQQKKKELLDILHENCEKAGLLGITHQYICVARKPVKPEQRSD